MSVPIRRCGIAQKEGGLAIVKLGGSLVTDQRGHYSVSAERLSRLVREVLDVRSPVILVHGLGSFGKAVLCEARHSSDFFSQDQMEVAVSYEHAASQLNDSVVRTFLELGANAIGLCPSTIFGAVNGAVQIKDLGTIESCLALGIVPVVRGGLLFDAVRGPFACSSDNMVAALALALKTKVVVFATDVEGVYSKWPPQDNAQVLPVVARLSTHSSTADATSEILPPSSPMFLKVERGLDCAAAVSVCRIIDGRRPGRLVAALRMMPTPGTLLRNMADTRNNQTT